MKSGQASPSVHGHRRTGTVGGLPTRFGKDGLLRGRRKHHVPGATKTNKQQQLCSLTEDLGAMRETALFDWCECVAEAAERMMEKSRAQGAMSDERLMNE